jgi:RNA polymerase sigma-70 factor (ECF subfamily)
METEPTKSAPGSWVDEGILITRVRKGDPAAERQLYETHVSQTYRLAYRLTGDEDLAKDLTQETFIRAFDKLDQFRGEAAFGTWLRSIATSVIYNGMRKVKRFRQREFDLDEVKAVGAGERNADPDVREKLWRAIDDLPAKYRMVFVMHDVEGYTHEEISSAVGSQVGTSKAQLSRARAKLREALSEFAEEWAS